MSINHAPVPSRPSITELLMRSEVLEELRGRFRYIQENMTTTIREAAFLTDLSEAQLRYAENKKMLAPNREELTEEIKGQRRYTTDDLLRAHIVAFFLNRGYTFAEIGMYMSDNPQLIQDVLQTNSIRLRSAIKVADTIQFSRFIVPRLLYFALSLIFERESVANVGLIIPVRPDARNLDDLTARKLPKVEDVEPVTQPEDLARLGQLLVAWRAEENPMITMLNAGNPFEREQLVTLVPIESILLSGSKHSRAALESRILLCYDPRVKPELEAARNAYEKRRERGPDRTPNPRDVAMRLIFEAQRVFQHRMSLGDELDTAKMQMYTAPEFISPALGDSLLNKLADSIVRLGDAGKEGEPRWRFAAVMSPRDPQAPLRQQELVVQAQSHLGPHRIGVTTTSPNRNGGLTYRAFSSGRIAYREEVSKLDPAISYLGVEGDIKSAIAAPTVELPGSERGQPPAVIYVTSKESRAFDADDLLLIRVMGRIVGEIVQTYKSRSHRPAALTDALVRPDIVDPLFSDFLSDSDFTSKLTAIFNAAGASGSPSDDASSEKDFRRSQVAERVTLVGLDINDYAHIAKGRGNMLGRLLIRAIGLRAKQRIEASFAPGADSTWFFHEWGDRFYALVLDEEADVARRRLERIHGELSGDYALDGEIIVPARTLFSAPAPGALEEVRIRADVRMVGMTLSRFELQDSIPGPVEHTGRNLTWEERIAVAVAGLSRRLEDGLRQAGEMIDSKKVMLWWSQEEHAFTRDDRPGGAASDLPHSMD